MVSCEGKMCILQLVCKRLQEVAASHQHEIGFRELYAAAKENLLVIAVITSRLPQSLAVYMEDNYFSLNTRKLLVNF